MATNDMTPTRNVALLIDADNASAATLDPVLTVLAELGTVNVRRVYGNWSKPALNSWRDMTVKHGIEPQQQFDLTKGKNATDMKMTIDAMDLLFRGKVEAFGIMSSDSDFMPLAMRIRQEGIPVYGFGTSRAPEAFRRACTRFIDVNAISLPVEEDAAPVPAPAAVPPPAPAASPAPAATPAPRVPVQTDVPIAESLPPPIAARPKLPVDDELLKLLIDAYDASKRDEKGYVNLSAMGQLAANRSSFDVRNYGYKRLSDLIESVANFKLERREGGQSYVKRVR
ncbi:NYN domain-containing protein [Sphingomonas ginsenosidimutans]|uniref:NYN domain-containing protein n=1 Tax=Sphingomonas ginsenosidimutans TaxID=862134 RepID=UPI000877A733|nr:NYN domain-containing protein [Sphingomonas ginsenosidimutans]MBY0302946.1 NYN domain-containing protein [Sphingomonas ginsenosidimutans]